MDKQIIKQVKENMSLILVSDTTDEIVAVRVKKVSKIMNIPTKPFMNTKNRKTESIMKKNLTMTMGLFQKDARN